MDRYLTSRVPSELKRSRQSDTNDVAVGPLQNSPKFNYLFDEFYKLISINGEKLIASCVNCHKNISGSTKSSGNLLSHIKVSF